MKLHFLVEFPGWQKATMQMLKVSANGVIVRSSLEPGTTKIEIPLVPGIKKIRIIANTIFKMPSPDPRECSIRIKELNFHIIE